MLFYQIKKWDIDQNCNDNIFPIIYFNIDMPFLEYARVNEWRVRIQIKDTCSLHDGKIYWGVVDRSNITDNGNDLYVVQLECNNINIPLRNGYFIPYNWCI